MGFLIGVSIVCGCLSIMGFIIRSREESKKEKTKITYNTKIEKLNQAFSEGSWEFPAEKFYQLCYDSKVLALNDDFSVQKAALLAKQLIEEQVIDEFIDDLMIVNIDLLNFDEYLKKENLEKFFAKGEKLFREANERKITEQKQPRNIKPNKNEETFINRSSKLFHLYGRDKRTQMLTNLIQDYDDKIQGLKDGEKALIQLGMIYADQQQKESDWAIVGGIAEGIAGPAAGLAAAANTMASNTKIREHNAAMRRASMDIMSGIPELSGDRYKLEKEREHIRQQLRAAESKVVLAEPSKNEIWKNTKAGKSAVKKNESGVLTVTLPITIKEPFVLDIPDGVSMVVDGTIKGEVWFEDKLVGDVHFPLPLSGIPTNMTEEVALDGMCGRSVEFDGEYTVKIADDQNLWIMEA